MLFDLRSGARRRTVKIVYLGLALLMFVGFVGFGIGSSGLSGSIGDLIRDNGGGGGNSAADANERLAAQARSAEAAAKASPTDAAKWAAAAQARVRLSVVGDNFDSNTGDYTAAGKRQLQAASANWDKYMALKPKPVDERLAKQMAQAFLSLNQADKAVTALETLTESDPSQQTFQNLAVYAYQAGQLRKGDLAAGRAVELAPKDQQKQLKTQLDQAKQQATVNQMQQAAPTPTPTL
jgi:tetratricopeptide (TPR) repeat protein